MSMVHDVVLVYHVPEIYYSLSVLWVYGMIEAETLPSDLVGQHTEGWGVSEEVRGTSCSEKEERVLWPNI